MVSKEIFGWIFLISCVSSLWALTYLAFKVANMLKELRVLLSTSSLALHVSANRELRTSETLNKIQEVATNTETAALQSASNAARAQGDLAEKIAEVKAAVQEIKELN